VASRPKVSSSPLLFFIMVDWDKQRDRLDELASGSRPKDGDIINLDMVREIDEREDSFVVNGKTVKVLRFVYVLEDETEIVVPVSLHGKIAKLEKEYGDRLTTVKVRVEGEGLKTRYDALPLIQ